MLEEEEDDLEAPFPIDLTAKDGACGRLLLCALGLWWWCLGREGALPHRPHRQGRCVREGSPATAVNAGEAGKGRGDAIHDVRLPACLWHAGLCLAHLGRLQEATEALQPLLEAGPEQFPDLFLDVGVALASMGRFEQARTYLQPLVVSTAVGCFAALRHGPRDRRRTRVCSPPQSGPSKRLQAPLQPRTGPAAASHRPRCSLTLRGGCLPARWRTTSRHAGRRCAHAHSSRGALLSRFSTLRAAAACCCSAAPRTCRTCPWTPAS